MKVTRRDLLVWSAGAAAGLMVTPVPWKLLDDISIWSQNWGWIPQPSHGPVDVKQSFCTLCPRGCGIKVRMAGGWPVGIAGSATHPVNRGALCPLAFGAHQLNSDPKRLRAVRHHGNPASWEDARAAFAKCCNEGPVVIVDGHPGRAASVVLEKFAVNRGGQYRVVDSTETDALRPYEKWSGVPASELGYDLENAQTIVSFGTPLLDGWGIPGQFTRLWAEQAAGQNDPQLRLIQVESELSRTAARAWQWVPIHAGAESALASGIARVLLEEKLVAARGPVPLMTLAEVAIQTGLSPDAIRDLTRSIMAQRPVVAVANDADPAIAALNVLLGAVGAPGGIVRRSKSSTLQVVADSVIPNARAVLLDSTVPWDFVPKTDAEVFRFAAWDAGLSKADWLLPAPGFLEDLTDIPSAPSLPVDTYAVAPNLVRAPHPVQNAAQFLASVNSSLPTVEQIIHARCDNLFRSRAGRLSGLQPTPVTSFASCQKLEEELRNGGVWMAEPLTESFRCELKQWPDPFVSSRPEGWSTSWTSGVLPPLASKLYQESNLRDARERRNA